MSAATASSTDVATVYVRLLNEGVDVWRPVQARRLSEATYRLSDTPAPGDEEWTFRPGDVVAGLVLGDGLPEALVAVARASAFDARSQAAQRLAG